MAVGLTAYDIYKQTQPCIHCDPGYDIFTNVHAPSPALNDLRPDNTMEITREVINERKEISGLERTIKFIIRCKN